MKRLLLPHLSFASALLLASTAIAPRAFAQAAPSPPPAPAPAPSSPLDPSAVRAQASVHFDRGLRLFESGDNAGALAEFKRAYELIPNVVVLYNIGLVYAQLGRAVEATDALRQVLANPSGLSPERLENAHRTHDAMAERVAEVTVTVSVEGAAVEVDGIEVGKSPLPAPVRVTSGTHVLGAVLPGYAPQRKEVTIAGGETQILSFDLALMQGRLAHLAIKTHLPGADIFADGQRVGRTPLETSISLTPGNHRVELRRSGYLAAGTDVALADGATGEIVLEPEEDRAAVLQTGARLALDLRETQVVATIDGRARGVYTAPIALAAGPHHLLLERGDFEPLERDVTVEPGRTTTVRAALDPTPEYRARYDSGARTQRIAGMIATIGGGVVLAGGVGLVIYDAGQRSDGNSAKNALLAQSTRGSNGACDPGIAADTYQTTCVDPLSAAQSKIDAAGSRDVFGWTAVAVGATATVVGVVLLVTSNDPHAYDHPDAPPRPAGGVSAAPTFWTAPGGGGLGLTGAF